MQEKSLYGQIKVVISHLYKSISSDNNDLKIEILKRRIDFIRNEIILLGDELQKREDEFDILNINKTLDALKIPKGEDDEFKEFGD